MSCTLLLALAISPDARADDASPAEVPVQSPVPPASEAPPRDPAIVAAELFRDGRYAEAAAAFDRAYRATGDPAFLFGRAQALRRGGNCGAAMEVFETFIETGPPPRDVEEAERVIEACREILGQGPSTPTTAPTPAPPPEPADDRDAPEPRPWHRDVAGGVLLGTGLVLAATGGGLYGGAFVRARDRVETESQYERREDTARALGAAGIALMVTGGAAIVGSIVRYAITARRGRRSLGVDTSLGAPLSWRF